jgi:acid phosphatase family membrane protein YuiD
MKTIVTSAALAWIMAQALKVLIGFLRHGSGEKPRALWRIIWAGGMPSAHSALVTSSTLSLFWSCGPQSSLYGFALVMTGVVIYDRSRMFAIYMTFQKKFPALEREVRNDPLLQDLVGHRPLEIVVGILIGLGAGLLAHALLPI